MLFKSCPYPNLFSESKFHYFSRSSIARHLSSYPLSSHFYVCVKIKPKEYYKYKFIIENTQLCISFGLKVTLVYTILKTNNNTNDTYSIQQFYDHYHTRLKIKHFYLFIYNNQE